MPQHALAITPASFATFGELLRFLRHRAQLTQRALAAAVGYSEAQISRLEQNQRAPDPAALRALFVPALGLEREPAWVARLLDLGSQRAAQIDNASHWTGQAAAVPATQGAVLQSDGLVTNSTLLATKLYMPRPNLEIVARPRLTARLDDALRVPFTLVAAPAGFGKTTLLVEWLSGIERRAADAADGAAPGFAWLSLDAGDNDPSIFLRYLIAALQTILPSVGTAAVAALAAPHPPPLQVLLTGVLNDLATLRQHGLLVLDDYHAITTPAIHQAMTFLLDHLPPCLHVLLATRADPPLPLARFRARRQLVEVRAADLRFTADETSAFLTQIMHVSLPAADVSALEGRTEGWIAGLQLAALVVRGCDEPARFIAAFTGSNRFVIDYLAAEVLDQLPPHLRTFVLQTSILDRMCGPLCDAVLGVGDQPAPSSGEAGSGIRGDVLIPDPRPQSPDSYSQLILDQLERMNLFLVPLDDERGWYRYHHLFGEVLRERLKRGAARATVAGLHRRASAWYEQQGLIAAAVQHALAARDWMPAAGMIEQHAETMRKQGEYVTLRRWLDGLPAEVVRARPRLSLLRASIFVIAHQLDAAEQCLQDVEQAVPAETADPAHQSSILSEAAVIGAGIALNRNDVLRATGLACQALDGLPADKPHLRGEAMLLLGLAYAFGGKGDAARQAYTEAIRLSQLAGDIHTTLFAYCTMAGLCHAQGQLLHAAALYQQALQLAAERDAEQMPIMGLIHADYAELLYEWNDLEAAADHAREAIRRGERGTTPRFLLFGYVNMARVLQTRGDAADALGMLQKAERLVQTHALPPYHASTVAGCRVELWLAQKNSTAAIEWAQARGLNIADELDYAHEAEHIALARVCIVQGRRDLAGALLTQLQQAAEASGRTRSVIAILALQAVVRAADDDHASARPLVMHALSLAEPQGYIRTFVDAGAALGDLLRQIPQHLLPVAPAYLARLLAAFDQGSGFRGQGSGVSRLAPDLRPLPPLVETLTSRELEVLRLLAIGHSNQEIGGALVVSTGTVKRHISNIFAKLNVQSRTQAVARARDLGLL